MRKIRLEEKIIEDYFGRKTILIPKLLKKWENREGFFYSEGDFRLFAVRNFKDNPEFIKDYRDTSTLLATKNEFVKIILPYKNDKLLTDVGKFALELINSKEDLFYDGIDLDIDNRWDKLKGDGVYLFKRGNFISDRNLSGIEAMDNELLLTVLGHPDYVDFDFSRSKNEVAEIIGRTFELGRKYFKDNFVYMMGQWLPEVQKKGILKLRTINELKYGTGSNSYPIDAVGGKFIFEKNI